MSIQHKFFNTNFGGGLQTNSAILDTTPYLPEVMIVGTFNPNGPNANFADFFYGRNFFWPAFKNLFFHNAIVSTNRRMPPNGNPQAILDPSIQEIINYCINLKLTFADLVVEVLHNGNPFYQVLQNDNVIFNGTEYNLIQDGLKGGIGGLQQLNAIGQVNWNTQSIIDYLSENPQIETIYFTRRPTGIWATEWNLIINHPSVQGRYATNLFTPSAAGAPVHRSMIRLLNHWIHNNNPNFGTLDHLWLAQHGVTPNNFRV